jgi:hypothetical protein
MDPIKPQSRERIAMATSKSKSIAALCLAFAATLIAAQGLAESTTQFPPRISYVQGQYFKNNPKAWAEFLASMPKAEAGQVEPAVQNDAPKAGGTWTALADAPGQIGNPLLLTDGTVMVQQAGTKKWAKLTPDINGSYANGTWSDLASLPVINGTQYAPLYHSSAVLPDGRVLIMGGEYNNFVPIWTNLGAIYDPIADTWTPVPHPPGWGTFSDGTGVIGDAQSIVLANGTYLQGACCLLPAGNALFDAATLTWTETGAPRFGNFYQDEQGYNLLPSGKILTVDIWTDFDFNNGSSSGNSTNTELYNPSAGIWAAGTDTPVSMVDPFECGNFEIGPAVMRPDGTLVHFGGNTGCAPVPKPDPTAIYNTVTGTWTAGPVVPIACGKFKNRRCDLADAPAAILPNGNILFAASAGFGGSPTRFFEFGADNTITQVATTQVHAQHSGAFVYNFLVLPNGEILSTDFSNTAEVYTPTGAPNPAWAPKITVFPPTVTAGVSYPISGTQFNGLSQGAGYGDDVQGATNYPLVRITNNSTGHVFYARTANHSTMSIAPHTKGSTTFTVPGSVETGASTLEVVANGIASAAVPIEVN